MKSSNSNISGIINIYKEKGYTSHDVVNIVRKTLGRIKTGHTGTLDPDAEGVLPVCVGKATKLADYITASVKQYRAQITLGVTTTTEDATGEVLERREVNVTEEQLRAAAESFMGEYYQTPPMYSAIKVNGKKLYELAREGKEIERKKRLIHIYAVDDIHFIDKTTAQMLVTCSKGTYIRTLCKDIGEKLGCGACMSALTRCKSGRFSIENSIRIDDFKALAAEGRLDEVLLGMDKALEDYKSVTVSDAAEKYLANGNIISLNYCLGEPELDMGEKVVVYDENKKIVGIYQVKADCLKPVTMLR